MRPIQAEVLPHVRLDGRLAVFFEETRTLAIADLHWGYAISHRAAGNLLPAWGDEEIEQRLHSLIADYQPAEMVWVGDSIHDLAGRSAAEVFIRACPVPIRILSGNHDRDWEMAAASSLQRGRFLFHHGNLPVECEEGVTEVIGHFHPAFSWRDGAGGRVKLPGLVAGARRLILPAFSPWAAGVRWNDELEPDEQFWVISKRRIFAVRSQPARVSA